MEIPSPEQAREAIKLAVGRATERYVAQIAPEGETIKFPDLLGKTLPTMALRVLRSVEDSFWRKELERRKNDQRFDYADPALQTAVATWDAALRKCMVLSRKELYQLINRALTLQMDSLVAPIDSLKANYFVRQEKVAAKSAVVLASHLGFEERYVRALSLMAQDDEKRLLSADTVQRVFRDVDAKEFQGSKDRAAVSVLSNALLVLGIRAEDELGEAPVDLALAVMVLRGTPEGTAKVAELCEGRALVDMLDVDSLFMPEQTTVTEDESHEEAQAFLDDLGIDQDAVEGGEAELETGGVRFVLTEEEKRAYISRAVGRHTHLIEPIMKATEAALTWEEVDRAINDLVPDDDRDEDLSARFRERLGRR